jgi:hypothetical protein
VIFEVTTQLALILILSAFIAGFVDSIAGGGGLITVPMLLLAGASPLQALATNKVQGSFGAATTAFTDVPVGFSPVASRTMSKLCLIRWYQHLTVVVDPTHDDLRERVGTSHLRAPA